MFSNITLKRILQFYNSEKLVFHNRSCYPEENVKVKTHTLVRYSPQLIKIKGLCQHNLLQKCRY